LERKRQESVLLDVALDKIRGRLPQKDDEECGEGGNYPPVEDKDVYFGLRFLLGQSLESLFDPTGGVSAG